MKPGSGTPPLNENPPVPLPDCDKLDIGIFDRMLNGANVTNSYKLYWFAAIFDGIQCARRELSFREIVLKMITKCWYTVTKYRLTLGSRDHLGDVVSYIYEKYKFKSNISPQDLYTCLENLQDNELEKGVTHFYRYVPYRLISPFYPQLKGLEDYKKDPKIEALSRGASDASLYQIYSQDKRIVVNKNWFDYIYCNQPVVDGWYREKLINFLQSRNPGTPEISSKLEASQTRVLKPARIFWERIIALNPILDIYTGQPVSLDDLSIDHFIPRNYVMHDLLWNLAPTTRSVNSSKSDGLPSLERYLDSFCRLHSSAYRLALKEGFPPRMLEDYLEVNQGTRDMKPEAFERNLREQLAPLHQMARNRGFPLWEKSSRI